MGIVVGTYVITAVVGGCCLFLVMKGMCDYIIKRILDHLEMRGVFDTVLPHEPSTDEVIETWTSNFPIVDNDFWGMHAPVVEPTLDAMLSDDGFITVSASDCSGSAWDSVTVRTDIVRSNGNVVGEAELKMKRWEREHGTDNSI